MCYKIRAIAILCYIIRYLYVNALELAYNCHNLHNYNKLFFFTVLKSKVIIISVVIYLCTIIKNSSCLMICIYPVISQQSKRSTLRSF